MLKRLVQMFAGDPSKRAIDKYSGTVDEINALEAEYEKLSNAELRAKTEEFKGRLAKDETLDDLLVEAYAIVREASKRTIGLRHYDVQLIGGIVLHEGKIAEMRTGEGKTLVATLPIYLNALAGRGVHLITVNDYLARRDARWMAPIYDLLGLRIGVLQIAARTENGRKAFIVDLQKESPHEDQHQLIMVDRREAYEADITYGTNSEFGFDYLRDNMTMRLEDRVQRRGHFYAIIDEVDNVLIDEARTPLIISGPAQDESEWYEKMALVVRQLRPEDYEISEKDRTVTLTEIGEVHVEELLGVALRDPDRPEDVTPEQARMLGYLEQALRAQYLFRRNKDYLVQGGKVVIIDEFTGRLMPGRRWSDGLHQAVEAKEGVKVESESVTYATITIQNYFRMYEKLSGMTGTAVTESEEFNEIYKLDVIAIPTNLDYLAHRDSSDLEVVEARDEEGYKYQYYKTQGDANKKPQFWRRQDYPDVVYRTEETKLRAIALEILRFHALGRPVLVGTTSVELSDRVSGRLRAEPLRRLAQVQLLRQAWFRANGREEDGRLVESLQYLNERLEDLQIPEMRKMARDLNISFNPEDEQNLNTLLEVLRLPAESKERLVSDLKSGIPHEVLNARKHTEESQIIAGAGAFGAVTIATNMAGRGVDIKLGGELAEEIIAAANRVLNRAGYEDAYSMMMEERQEAVRQLTEEDYGIYDREIAFFMQHMEEMTRVRELGGLHVIGSERHEARRIDNQLRGRAARQGDPGSSRFYLSMQDELMRLFGGQQAESLMERLKIDEALPLEVGLVSRLVEQSQTRVEGANFDVRKHLLEYDDVLNTQRAKIYAQRDRIFTKEDLHDDISDMLRTEVERRVPQALEEEEEPWKLLAWLEQIQPAFNVYNEDIFPSYTQRLLLDQVFGPASTGERGNGRAINRDEAPKKLLEIANNALQAEERHLISTVNDLLNRTEDHLEEQINERFNTLDTFFEGLELQEESGEHLRPTALADELSALIRISLRLSTAEQRALVDDPDTARSDIQDIIETELTRQTVIRLIGAVERRLEESLDLDAAQLTEKTWDELAEQILASIEAVFERRRERYLGPEGLVARDVEKAIKEHDGPLSNRQLLNLLAQITQGQKSAFDRKTHRRIWLRTTRFVYTYFVADFIRNREPEEVAADVLAHLEEGLIAMRRAWGLFELNRLSALSPAELESGAQEQLRQALGRAAYTELASQPLGRLQGEAREVVATELGRRALTELYRQLLLRVITELWVEYLTQMEALRVSIGLEAYAQRDPLVQYKNQAFQLFQDLLSNMRQSVITRMFTFRPRVESIQATSSRAELPDAEVTSTDGGDSTEPAPEPETVTARETAPAPKEKSGARERKGKPLSSAAKRRRSRR